MKKLLSLFICILIHQMAIAQWKWLNPRPQSDGYVDLFCVNDNVGIALTTSGNEVKTSDGGQSWTEMTKVSAGDFKSAFFVDENIGWVCGGDGDVFKTINGGR